MRAPVRRLIAISMAAASAACTVHQAEVPALSGPSALARSLTVTATPDRITQDGASQSSVVVQAFGPDGRALIGLAIRMDMSVDGQLVDYGTLSARTIVTGSDGAARVTYTAPPPAPPPANQVVTTVSIRAIPIGNDAQTAAQFSADVRLMPQGVILPPAGTPTAAFTLTPSPVAVNVPTTFDASASQAGTNANAITSYSWSWGDGTSNSTGRTATHTFTTGGTFNVTLTVTNDRGFSSSTTQGIGVSAVDPFTGDWISSPPIGVPVVVGQNVLFNADQVQTSAGHQVTVFNWNFGDGDTTQPTTGFLVTHKFAAAGSYSVVLSVADDLGRKKVFSPKIVVVGAGTPTASFTASIFNAGTHTMTFDGSASTAVSPATITSYQWAFGDGSFAGPSASATVNHTFGATGSYVVRLTVTDSAGRTGTSSQSVTVP